MATVTSSTRKLNPTSNTYETNSGLTVGTNIVVGGTVDGRDIASDGSKLDGIESSATADQTAAEIRALVESASNSNAFTDADHTKLNGIATSANNYSLPLSSSSTRGGVKVGFTESGKNYPVELSSEKMFVNVPWTDTNTNTTYTAGSGLTLSGTTFSHSDTSTQASSSNSGRTYIQSINVDGQGHVTGLSTATETVVNTDTNTQLSNEQVQDIVGAMVASNSESGITVTYQDADGTIDFSVASQTDQNFTNADHTKLNGIETGATADQTAAEIRALVESATDSNVFTNADHTKLNGIATGAEVNVQSNWNATSGDSYIQNKPTIPSGNQIIDWTSSQGSTQIHADNVTTALTGYATQSYVGTQITNLIDSSPSALNTLNELAAALGDDANFSTTVTNSIATKAPLASPSFTGDVVITDDTFPFIRSVTNGAGAGIRFSDQTGYGQQGTLKFVHSDGASYGSGASFILATSESTSTILADGKLMYGEGIYSKPSTGTGAGTRKDSNWDTAYGWGNHASAGYVTSNTQLSTEQVQDAVGAMLSGNTESGITVTYDDTNNEIDFTVASQTDQNFTNADHSKLNAIEASADVTDTTNVVAALTAGSNVTIAADGTISSSFTNTNTQLSNEQVQDIVGAMVSSNTESGIAVTYDDTGGKLNLTVASQTDQNFTNADHTKLNGIESGATADQTAAEIRALVESATDSNAFTDADHTKLNSVETSADVTDTTNVVAALTAGSNVTIAADGTISSSFTNTNTQLSNEQVQDIVGAMVASNSESGVTVTYQDADGTLDFSVASQTDQNFTNADHTKLNGIETGATADQTAAEIRALVESASDSNVFTNADHTKLNGIATGAEVNVQSNWNATSGDAYIQNKPTIPSGNQIIDWTSSQGSTQIHADNVSSAISAATAAPAAPTSVAATVVGETVDVTFNASSTSNIDSYLVYSSVDGSDYGLISIVPPDDFSSTMSVIDNSFTETGTQAYRVYAMKLGNMSSAGTASVAYSVSSLEPTNLSVVNLHCAYHVQWDAPSSNSRFVSVYNVYKHEHATQGSLSRSSASLVYSGTNTNFMYQISGSNNNNFHQFWVETTIA
jgi:hypothetical protein